ncbi:hypothetical protein D3C87_1237470 [compost metagenome]
MKLDRPKRRQRLVPLPIVFMISRDIEITKRGRNRAQKFELTQMTNNVAINDITRIDNKIGLYFLGELDKFLHKTKWQARTNMQIGNMQNTKTIKSLR